MKEGRTHLAYKAEHVVDLESEFVLAAFTLRQSGGEWKVMPTEWAELAGSIRDSRSGQSVENSIGGKPRPASSDK